MFEDALASYRDAFCLNLKAFRMINDSKRFEMSPVSNLFLRKLDVREKFGNSITAPCTIVRSGGYTLELTRIGNVVCA